jgi:pimeloyl-ACP methyl ester carboxylesterase
MDSFVCGNPKGRTVFFIAGWPDSCDVFGNNLIPLFMTRYRVVGLSLPGFRPGSDISSSAPATCSRFRYTLVQLVGLLQQSVSDHMKGDLTNLRPFIVAHDWGSMITFELHRECSGLFERIVALDIAGNVTGDSGAKHLTHYLFGAYSNCPTSKALWMMFYQFWIMICYFLPAIIGDYAIWFLACKLNGRPTYKTIVPAAAAGPSVPSPVVVRPRADMGWPYFHLWHSIFARTPLPTHEKLRDVSCPVLYVYGKDKPMQFHSQQWLDMLQRSQGCRVIEASGGHWFFAHPKGSAVCREIFEFIDASSH